MQKVTFFVDGEKACTDRRPPYQCKIFPEFVPRDRLTIVAIATDSAGQTSTDIGRLRLPNKLKPKGLSLHADANNRRVFADGKLKLPRTVDDRDGCDGKVEVEVRRQGDVVESEKVKLDRDCEYAVALQGQPRRPLPGDRPVPGERPAEAHLGRAGGGDGRMSPTRIKWLAAAVAADLRHRRAGGRWPRRSTPRRPARRTRATSATRRWRRRAPSAPPRTCRRCPPRTR